MGVIEANVFVGLDGVYQAPGGADEDHDGGFAFGGWQAPFFDAESGAAIGAGIANIDALLLGRKTYDIFAAYWPHADDDIGEILNRVPKYVVSTTLEHPSWAGTTVLPDAASVAAVRERHESIDLIGSGVLLRSLLTEGLVDRLNLWTYPVVFGSGKRLFGEGTAPESFRLAEPPRAFEKGAVLLVYEPAGPVETGDMDELDHEMRAG